MDLIRQLVEFIAYSILLVFVVKNFLTKALRGLGNALNLEAKTVGDIAGIATSMPELMKVKKE